MTLANTTGCAVEEVQLSAARDPLPEPDPPDEADARATIVHAVEPFELEGSQESVVCYSWTIDNDEPMYVEGVAFQNGGSLHHSNWFIVPEDVYPGDDGYWPCASRAYDEVSAALSGTVLFAQSTQAQAESVSFAEGVVIRIPPRSKLVADVHLLNLGPDPRSTAAWLSLDLLHPGLVEAVLSPIMLSYFDLDIPAMDRSRFTATCDEESTISSLPLELHYVLPHYHGAGASLSLSFTPSAGTPISIIEREGFDASALGETFDPPIELQAPGTLKFSCGYDNPYDRALTWGIGIDEMCVFLGLAVGPRIIVGGVAPGSSALMAVEDGVKEFEGRCQIATARRGRAYDLPTREEREGPLMLPPIADEPVPEPPTCQDVEGNDDAASSPSFDDVADRVFGPWCSFSSCHGFGGAGGLQLLGDAARDALVDVASTAPTSLPRVAPGDPEGSYLYRLLSECEPTDGDGTVVRHMPASAPTLLDPELVGLVRAWIEAGAP